MLPARRTSTPQPGLFDSIPSVAPRGWAQGLDPEQLAAATATDSGILVRAGAGTGKTRTLVARIAHLVEERGVDPASVVVATFTNKAAREIRDRVAGAIGPGPASGLRMGTFHSLGARFLRRHPSAVGLKPRFAILDDDGARASLVDAIKEGGFVKEENVAALAESAYPSIRLWKSWGLTVEAVEREGRARRSDEEERHAKVYVAYQNHLRSRNTVDFGDLVLLPVQAMNDGSKELLHLESSMVSHLLVDEAQDANPTQVMFARCLSMGNRNVFAVGDEDQSIFSFQGGYPEAIQQIAGVGAREFTLVRNRRCTDEILEPAVRLVGWNRRKAPKVLRSGRSGEKPRVVTTGSEREEAVKIARHVKSLMESGERPGEIAVLGRSAYVFAQIEESFLREAIPYEVIGAGGFIDREEVKDILAYMMLARDLNDSHSFARIANKPARGFGPSTLEVISRARTETGEDYLSILSNPSRTRIGGDAARSSARFAQILDDMTDAYDREAETDFVLGMILCPQGFGYEEYILSRKEDKARKARRAESLLSLRRLAQEHPSIDAFMERVSLAQDDDVHREGGRVRISTMHSSKGLEWDHVVCMAMDENVIPSPRALEQGRVGKPGDAWNGPRGGGMEEERRLAHVAFTRARHTLTVFAPLSRNGKGTAPSAFLPESDLDPYEAIDPFAVKGNIGKKGLGKARAGRKGFTRGA